MAFTGCRPRRERKGTVSQDIEKMISEIAEIYNNTEKGDMRLDRWLDRKVAEAIEAFPGFTARQIRRMIGDRLEVIERRGH